jgi:hypothetical protein
MGPVFWLYRFSDLEAASDTPFACGTDRVVGLHRLAALLVFAAENQAVAGGAGRAKSRAAQALNGKFLW